MRTSFRTVLGALLAASLGGGQPHAQTPAAQVAFKVTSVHFSKAVESALDGVVTPLEVTEAWQKALTKNAKFRVIGFDEPAAQAEFGGALLAASATVTKTDVYKIGIGQRQGGYAAALVALTATFLDPATGEVFYQGYVEVSAPASFLPLFDQDRDIEFKELSKFYQAVTEGDQASFARKQFRGLVLSGLEKLAAEAAKKYKPAVEEGKVLGQWKGAEGQDQAAVDLGFANGLVRGSILRIYNPAEQEKPVAQAEVVRVEQGRAQCRVFGQVFGREVREGFIARAIGVNQLQRPKAGSLVLQVTGFGTEKHATYDPSFTVDEDIDSMGLSDALGQGGEFFLLAPLPSVSAVADTAEFAEGVEVAEEDIFGRRRIADVGVKGNFFKASVLREVKSSDALQKMGKGETGTRLHQELELRLGLEFYDIYTGALLFTSETKRVQELVDELYDADGEQVTDVSEEAGFRRLARSVIREAAEDARKRFRSATVSGKIAAVQGDVLEIELPAGANVGPRTVLTVWRPGTDGALQEGFPRRLGLASVQQVSARKVTAQFVPAKGVDEPAREGDEVQVRLGSSGAELPIVQVEQVQLAGGLDAHMKLSEASLVELVHVSLGSVEAVQSVPPAYRALELEKDAQLFRDGDYNLEQAEKMLEAKIHSVDYLLRGQVQEAKLEILRQGSIQTPTFTLKMQVQLIDPASGKVIYEKSASGKRSPKDQAAATQVRNGRVIKGVREEDYSQEFEYLAKDLLDALVPHVLKKGLSPA